MTDQEASVAVDGKQQTLPDQTVAEREPAPRRRAKYRGDQRHLLAGDERTWLGPDRRGIMWRPCHADYHDENNNTVVIFAPVAPHDVAKVPGLVERIQFIQQTQAAAMGAVAHLGGM